MTKRLAALIILLCAAVGCQKTDAISTDYTGVDHRVFGHSIHEDCQVLSQAIGHNPPLLVTDKHDPKAILIEFSWMKVGEKNERKLDCFFK